MMLSLQVSAQMRIQHLSQTPQLLYTQNDVFAEAFCTDAYTLSAQCTCFRSKLLCRSVYIAPRRRAGFCIRKMMFLLKLSAQMRTHCPSQMPQLLYTQNDAFIEGFCMEAYTISLQTPLFLYTQNDAFAEGFCIKAYTSPLADAPVFVYAKSCFR